MTSTQAQKQWEVENKVAIEDDKVYEFDKKEFKILQDTRPWKGIPHYFKNVKISALATLKMLLHARKGISEVSEDEDFEVAGMLLGYAKGDTFVVLDVVAAPRKGTSVRVNLTDEDWEYMRLFNDETKAAGGVNQVIGWYHSHPGYGCFFSLVDLNTQRNNQLYNEPWLGIVVDPKRSVSTGRVQMKSFRSWPEGYTPPEGAKWSFEDVPEEFEKEMGVHAKDYYELKQSVFRSSLDDKLFKLLWEKYWVAVFSSSKNLTNLEYSVSQVKNLSVKYGRAESDLDKPSSFTPHVKKEKKDDQVEDESNFTKCVKESSKVAIEHLLGEFDQVVKATLFNSRYASS